MKKIAYYISVFLLAGIIVIACKKDDDNPPGTDAHTVTGFSPASGAVGTTVTVNGTNFADENISVAFNGTSSSVSSVSTNGQSLTTTVPEGANTGKITVSINGTAVNSSENFTVNVPQIELAATTLEMRTLETAQFPEVTNPDDFEDKTPSYQTEDPDIVVVDEDGGLTALQAGEATLNVSLGDSSSDVTVTVNPSIFVAGKIRQNGNNDIATIWVNGEAIALDQPIDNPETKAVDLIIQGSDIYATGQAERQSGYQILVWKNNQIVSEITDGSNYSFASAIAQDDSNILVTGTTDGDARYWSNTTEFDLGGEAISSEANDILVNQNDIIIAGRKQIADEDYLAGYWENGEFITLVNGNLNDTASSLFLQGSDLYVGGYNSKKAQIWKNDVLLFEYGDDTFDAELNSLFVEGNNVYATGISTESFTDAAILWINNQAFELTTGTIQSWGESVYVYNGLVYVAGYKETEEDTEMATVWVLDTNGTILDEFNYPSEESSYAHAIVVK